MYISNINSSSIKLHAINKEEMITKQPITIYSEDQVTLLYIIKGGGNFETELSNGQFKKEDLLILNPGMELTIEPLRKVEWIKFTLSGILFISSIDIDSTKQLYVTHDDTRQMKAYLDLALIEDANESEGTALITKKLIECVVAHILRSKDLTIKDDSVQVEDDEIQLVQRYIRENYSKRLTLDQLASHIGMRKYYFIRVFKQRTGLSPIDYLIQVRLAEAERLLAESNYTVSKIADYVGFHSPSYFSKSFKEVNDCTPSEYRKKNTKEMNKRIS